MKHNCIKCRSMGMEHVRQQGQESRKVLVLASVASMIDQFNMPNIRLLQEMGYEVHAACNFETGNTCSTGRIRKFRQMLENMRVRWHQWDCPREIYAVQACCRAYVQLWELTGKYHFAWIHCQSPAGGVLARLAAYRRGMRVIYTAHGFHFYHGAPMKNWLLFYPVEKLLSYWTDLLVTVNQEDYRLAKGKMKAGKTFYIPGVGIDISRFQKPGAGQQEKDAFRITYGIPKDAVLLLSVGELSRRKNHRAAVAAVAALQRKDIYYMICGQGRQEEALMRLAEKTGISQRVRLVGFQEHVEVFYRNADIFVFPSIQEGMPAALMEAMAAGMPCVASDIRGNRELVDDAGGICFQPERPEQLRKALERMLDDRAYMSACGRYNQVKIKRFGQAAVQKRMRKIYGEIS